MDQQACATSSRYAEGLPVVEIEKLVYGGEGLARVDGRVVFVPFVMPGEKVALVEPIPPGRKPARAGVREWIRPAGERVEPGCPIFTRCGGCHYQQIPYQRQLEYKVEILRETLARVGKTEWAGAVETVSAEPWGYRNRTRLHIARRGAGGDEAGLKGEQGRRGGRVVGFFEAGSHRLIESATCPINSPLLNRAHEALATIVAERRFPRFIREVEFFTNESEVLMEIPDPGRALPPGFAELCAECIPGLTTEPAIDYPVGSHSYQVGAGSFFQVNRFLVDRLSDVVLAGASTGTGNGSTGGSAGKALDLYAGVGIFGIPLAERFEHVKAVDSSTRAVRCLQENARRAGVSVQTVHLRVEEYLRGTSEKFDFVVADPSRAGLGAAVTEQLVRIGPKRLVLVSCDPATLARDLRVLVGGGFAIEKMTLVDLFPQTYHLETVVELAFADRRLSLGQVGEEAS